MTNLALKYQNEIAAIKADAQANLEEARATEEALSYERDDCLSVVQKLRYKAASSHRAFFKVAFSLIKMAFSHNPSISDVNIATQPYNEYSEAMADLPEAEATFDKAQADLNRAQEDLTFAAYQLDTFLSIW